MEYTPAVSIFTKYEGRQSDVTDQRAVVKSRAMIPRKTHNLQLTG
jgi:hypothetical protein